MADEKIISSRAFSKFELHIESDGNELNIPINLGMSDEEVRKIYPYLLSISRMEDNPMIKFAKMQESGEINKYTPEEQEKYEMWANRMSRYWYGKPSTSLLDIAIGLAIDMKFHGTRLGDIEDVPDNEYEGNMSNPMNPEPDALSKSETIGLENEYNIGPDAEAPVTLGDSNAKHSVSAGNIEVNIYGDESVDDFLSSQLDQMESKLDYKDRFAEMIQKDYESSNISEDRYKLQSIKGKTISDDDIDKDSGLLVLYDDTSIFDRVNNEIEGVQDDSDEDSDDFEFDTETIDTDEAVEPWEIDASDDDE